MTFRHSTRVWVMDDSPLPEVSMGGRAHNIPFITFATADDSHGVEVGVHTSHENPATWLRDTAARLIELAEQVDAHRAADGRVA